MNMERTSTSSTSPVIGFPHALPTLRATTTSPTKAEESPAKAAEVILRWKLEEWRQPGDRPHHVPSPPAEWAGVLHQMNELAQPSSPSPAWWTPAKTFDEGPRAQADSGAVAALPHAHAGATVYFLLSLSGYGHFQIQGEAPQRIGPGQALFALNPSRHRCFLPDDSPGWTFAWIGICHPYLRGRIGKQVEDSGYVIDVRPDGELMTRVLRLLRGTVRKEFRDHFEAELALFEFVVTFERWAQQDHEGGAEQQRLVDEVRSHIVAKLPEAIAVGALAAKFGMSRSHFSHLFRERTGLTPAHFATEVRIQEAIRMLLDSRVPLQNIAEACGFSSASHFCKVFRRHRHLSPSAFRQVRR
jgi:AraC-like DNA-binding protein